MIDFFFLIPIAIGMGLVGLASFMWTLRSGQHDDLEGAIQRILLEGNEGPVLEEKRPTPPPTSCRKPRVQNSPNWGRPSVRSAHLHSPTRRMHGPFGRAVLRTR